MVVLLDVLQEHLEEAEILVGRRREALVSPTLDLAGLAKLEDRLDAHLDGLAAAVEAPWPELTPALESDDPDRAFAAAGAMLHDGAHERLLDALERAKPVAARGIVEALCYVGLAGAAESRLRAWLDGAEPARAADALEVLSFHRRLEPVAVERLMRSAALPVRMAAVRAAGRVGASGSWLEALMGDRQPELRDPALLSGARLGVAGALDRLRGACRDHQPATPRVLRLLGALGDRRDVDLLCRCAGTAERGEAAVSALAALGVVDAVPRLLEFMGDARLARAAGEAFRRITGLELPEKGGEPATPEAEEADFEDPRPVPDAAAAGAVWRERSREFDPKLRWRHGRPLETEAWKEAPHAGDLLTRREELTRLWMREPALFPKLEPDAPAARQRAAA